MTILTLRDLGLVGGGVLWTPAQISTALWLDAADASTITASSGLISQINDKSGNDRNFTSSSSARPTLTSNGLNGKAVMTFSGSQYLTSTNTAATWNFMHNTSGCSFWLVGKAGNVSNPQAEYNFMGTNAAASANIGHVFFYSDIDNGGGKNNDLIIDFITRGVSGSYNTVNISLNNALAANAAFLASVIRDPGNGTAANRSNIRINGGSAIALNAATNAASSGNASFALQIGAAGNNAFPMTGYISEVIIQQSQASLDTLQKTEGYLAHKWGLTANLPSDHPYKTAPPLT
jgi:hypothetical protein